MNKEYIITVFSENKVGLLSQITTVFTCRDINIESLTTSESSIPGIHKFTIVVITDPEKISGTTGNRTLQSHPEQQCRKIGTRPPCTDTGNL